MNILQTTGKTVDESFIDYNRETFKQLCAEIGSFEHLIRILINQIKDEKSDGAA